MDLSEKLRNPSTPTIYSHDVAIMRMAADEIDLLRATMFRLLDPEDLGWAVSQEVRNIVNKALYSGSP